MKILQPDVTELNSYTGGAFQQAISAISTTNQDCYQQNTGCYEIYGFEYKPGYDDGVCIFILFLSYWFLVALIEFD
jgi:beta-glucanase (GH16 family)